LGNSAPPAAAPAAASSGARVPESARAPEPAREERLQARSASRPEARPEARPPEARAAAPSIERSGASAGEAVEQAAGDDADDGGFDLSRFKKIERPSTGQEATQESARASQFSSQGPRLARPSPAAGDAKAAAAIGTAFFGPAGSRGLGAAAQEPLDEGSRAVALEEYRDRQAQAKQVAVEGFMQGMQAQFGVTPRAIVQAFGKMDQESLMGPPEGARESFRDNLGLKGGPRRQAGAMYDEMARATGEAMAKQKLADRELGADFEVLSAGESSLRRLNASLDKLNDSFFLRGMPQAGPFGQPLARASQGDDLGASHGLDPSLGAQARASESGGRKGKSSAASPDSGVAPQMTAATAAKAGWAGAGANGIGNSIGALGPFSMAQAPGGAGQESLGAGEDDDESGAFAAAGSAQGYRPYGDADALAAGASLSQPQFPTPQQTTSIAARGAYGASASRGRPDQAGALAAPKKAAAEAGSSQASAAGAIAPDASAAQAPSALAAGAAAAKNAAGGALGAAGEPTEFAIGPRPAPGDSEANIQEIIRQASVIAKKGGGEMKLELRPEGMGQVNLRVSVQEGQVNVQMVTESNEAKRMLEGSLHDLKSGLSAHKLQLEALRIDSHDGIQKQMEQQQREAQREAARQFAGDFMGGFREDREAFRQAFSDGLPLRSYRGAPKPAMEEPSSGSARSDSSRRLNLVA
jgi:flagellar hook-length control protein FliK